MGMNDPTFFARGHYAVAWDATNEIGIGVIVLESDLPAIPIGFGGSRGFRARLYVTKDDLNDLIQALQDHSKKMFGG